MITIPVFTIHTPSMLHVPCLFIATPVRADAAARRAQRPAPRSPRCCPTS